MQLPYVLIGLATFLISYPLFHVVREKTRKKAKIDDSSASPDDGKNEALNCPFARALANENVQKSFGILNSFVSGCPAVRSLFRSEMIKRKNSLDTRTTELAAILTNSVAQITRDKVTLKEVAQFLTMRTALDLLLPDFQLPASSPPFPPTFTSPLLSPSPSYPTLLRAADLIDELWKSPDPRKTAELTGIFSPELLSRLIPMYESQWRVVFYALLEYFRGNRSKFEKFEDSEKSEEIEKTDNFEESEKSEKMRMDEIESSLLVKETLRMYAPVKSVKRKVKGKGGEETFVYPIAEVMRSKEIWGEDAMEFNPERKYEKRHEEEIRKVFGMGDLKCIAGIKFVQDFCGAIVRKVVEEFEKVDEGEWEELPSPLVNARGMYEDLYVRKV